MKNYYATPMSLVFLAIVVSLTGCSKPGKELLIPSTYQDICRLEPQQLSAMDENDIFKWVKKEYGVTPTNTGTLDNTNATIYAWNDGSERGNVYVRDGYAFRISFFSVDNGPTFEQVVGGLGEPKFIDRNHHIAHLNVITFDLYYPNLGILVSGASEMKRKDMMYTSDGASARLLRTVPVDVIHCYTPGSIETILTDVFLHPNEDSQQKMELLKPWPGFDAMVRLDY